MNNKNIALTMIRTASKITGINIKLNEPLDIDYINGEAEEDDIVIAGNNCTIFLEDLENSIIKRNTIYIKHYYILHLS
jgi:hypothetical protein